MLAAMKRALFLFALAALCRPTVAQPTPLHADFEAQFSVWLDGQVARAQEIAHVSFVEVASREIDSPYGVRRSAFEARLSGTPGEPSWDRELLAFTLNGEDIPRDKWDPMDRRWRHWLRGPVEEMTDILLIPPRLFPHLRPAGPPQHDDLDGIPAFRFDTLPKDAQGPIQRATFWFARDDFRLLRSRVLAQPPGRGNHLRVDVDYLRAEGLDVPQARRIEGTLQIKRRIRVFSALILYEATYRDYAFR